MLEFNLFLIDHWYYTVPLFGFIVMWFMSEKRRGGVRVSPNQLANIVNKHDGLVVDLRTKEEFEAGSITGSISIPFTDIDQRYEELIKHQTKPIILVCTLGRNSATSGDKLKKHGFTNLFVLKGGISTWQQEGLPLV